MSNDFDFEIDGLEELEEDLKKAIKKAPAQAEETLLKLAKDFKKTAKKKAEAELKPHERKGDQQKKAIKRKWGPKQTRLLHCSLTSRVQLASARSL